MLIEREKERASVTKARTKGAPRKRLTRRYGRARRAGASDRLDRVHVLERFEDPQQFGLR